jgi:hypothetical protein
MKVTHSVTYYFLRSNIILTRCSNAKHAENCDVTWTIISSWKVSWKCFNHVTFAFLILVIRVFTYEYSHMHLHAGNTEHLRNIMNGNFWATNSSCLNGSKPISPKKKMTLYINNHHKDILNKLLYSKNIHPLRHVTFWTSGPRQQSGV